MEGIVLQYGLAGVVILALTYVARVQYTRNNELQDKRIEDLKEISEKSNITIENLTEMVRQLKDALPKSKRGE